jgi:hypothetical protein
MRLAIGIISIATLSGCYTQTQVTRTVTRADGSTERYENRSTGYNYNPNWTGHSENTYTGHQYSVTASPSPFTTAQPNAFGQFTIR